MRIISMLFGLLFICFQAAGQGKIAGKVTDDKTGESIIGANVIIKGTANGTSTDIDGNYTLTVAPGTYTVEVKYIGYQQKEIADVKVVGKDITSLSMTITEATSTTLNEVVISTTMKKENVNALYVMQKNNVSVSSGISADVIQRSPDRNTGEVLKRVSGASLQNGKFVIIRGLNDRYNVAMVNGAMMPSTEPDRKAFSFDVIPSNLIDNIIISKTASPDMPGDMAGGVVQVLTKDVPEENFLNGSLSLGYNSQATFNDYKASKRTTGENFGFANSENRLPSSFGTNREDYLKQSPTAKTETAKQLPNNYGTQTTTALPSTSLQLSYGNATKFKNGDKLGSVVGVSYRNSYSNSPDFTRATWGAAGKANSEGIDQLVKYSSSLAGIANFAYVSGKSKISFRNLFTALHDQTNYSREGVNIGSSQQYTGYSSVPYDRKMYNTQLEGDHAFGKKNIKLNWNLNYSSLTAEQSDLRTVFYTKTIAFDADGAPIESVDPYVINDRNSRRYFSNLNDNNYGANVSVTVPFDMFGQNQSLKVGYMGLMRNRTFGARIFQYYYGNGITPGLPELPFDEVFDPNNLAYNTGFELQEITNTTDEYTASSFLNAGYVMLDNHLSEKWRLTWGARLESYNQNLQAVDLSKNKIDTTSVVMDILPSINLSFSPGEKTKLRLSGSRTVNRPEFREIAPFQFLDLENNWTIIGNPNLSRANITNIDLRYEYYPQAGEAITVGAFFKHFQNPIENRMDDQSNLDLLIFGFKNAPTATAIGAELDIRKNLAFIADAKWLENLIVGGNFTYVKSNVDVSSFGTAARPLQGQSPYLINFSLLYNDAKTGLGVSALYNRAGERIYIVGTSTIPTTWENGRDVLDFQISKSLFKKRAELKFTISDILNQPYNFYWNYDNSTTYSQGTDRSFQKYKLGTNYTLGFSYKFNK